MFYQINSILHIDVSKDGLHRLHQRRCQCSQKSSSSMHRSTPCRSSCLGSQQGNWFRRFQQRIFPCSHHGPSSRHHRTRHVGDGFGGVVVGLGGVVVVTVTGTVTATTGQVVMGTGSVVVVVTIGSNAISEYLQQNCPKRWLSFHATKAGS